MEAIVHSGALSSLHSDYKNVAEFLYIYILEAHPRDGWTLGENFSTMNHHDNLEDRLAAARNLIESDTKFRTFTTDAEDLSRVRLVVDPMTDAFANAYAAAPDRAYVIEGGKMAYIGNTIQKQCDDPYKLMTDFLREWLEVRFPAKK
ncbi:type I iodothyronine deiodinase-like [Ptychodera flava]|uniref:type I iodothyronine deiodinase-like n=1 Tax=Ptychodera flava TaxID=63121 RepID=UPI00396A2B6A